MIKAHLIVGSNQMEELNLYFFNTSQMAHLELVAPPNPAFATYLDRATMEVSVGKYWQPLLSSAS